MKTKAKVTGIVIAIGAAAVFATAPTLTFADGSDQVHCYGVNSCKGKGSCSSASNGCPGQNECRGKGTVEMSRDDCEQMGGQAL